MRWVPVKTCRYMLIGGAEVGNSGNIGNGQCTVVALLATNKATLTHSVGKHDIHHTVLTVQEFCSRLTYLRDVGDLPETSAKG